MWRRLVAIVSCFLSCFFVAGCGSGSQSETPGQSDSSQDPGETEPPTGPGDTDYPGLAETLAEDCRDLDSLEAAPTIAYYRLRVEYATSSDWSKLEFLDSSQSLKVRTMSQQGEAKKAIASYDGITVNQASDKAKAGNVISLTADYALRPEVLEQPLGFTLGQGSIGSVTLRFWAIVQGEERLLKELTEPKSAEFEVDLSSLKADPPWTAPLAPVRRMAWALYYPWYTMKGWEATHLKDWPQTLYDSSDPEAIERQISQAKSAGIDGFISSWWGPDTKTDNNLAVVLDVAAENDFFIGMFLETKSIVKSQNSDWALVADEMVRWFEYYFSNYADHPGTMKVDGKPFVMPWITCTVPVDTWKDVRDRLEAKGVELTMIADCTDVAYFDVFDGAKGNNVELGKTLRYYALLADTPAPKIWMSDARPGYDERLLEDRENPRYTDREDGQYFRRQLHEALLVNPQWVRIYTWNEYPENTYIEPSKNFGDKYLKIAGDYLRPWKCPD